MTDVVLERADLESAIEKANSKLEDAITKATNQAAEAGSASAEAKSAVEALAEKASEAVDRIVALEQRDEMVDESAPDSIGTQFAKSEAVAAMVEGRQSRARIDTKTAIINTYPASSVQPLVQGDRSMSIHATPNRRLTLRDILPVMPTSSNLVEFTREGTYTNNAGPQRDSASPLAAIENVTKPESAITFTLQTTPVVTLAHFIPLSKQVMGDAPQLESYINGRLMYGLKLYEETSLLRGSGTGGNINGIQTQATTYTVESPELTNEIDIIRDVITQAQVAEYSPNFIVLNPADWDSIQRRKVSSSDDRYVYGDPNQSWLATPLWGLTPIVTNSQNSGTFLIGDTNGCMVFDREQASVEASYENNDNFTTNMVDLRAEERLALAVFRTEAFYTGSL